MDFQILKHTYGLESHSSFTAASRNIRRWRDTLPPIIPSMQKTAILVSKRRNRTPPSLRMERNSITTTCRPCFKARNQSPKHLHHRRETLYDLSAELRNIIIKLALEGLRYLLLKPLHCQQDRPQETTRPLHSLEGTLSGGDLHVVSPSRARALFASRYQIHGY